MGIGEGKKLCRRRGPQPGHPVVELQHRGRSRRGDAFRDGEKVDRLPLVLHHTVETEEVAVKAVVVVVVGLFEMSGTLQAVVMRVDGLMMHV